MPKSTLALKATITRRQAEPIPSDMAERFQQLRDEEPAPYVVDPDKARQTAVEASTAIESEKSGKALKREANALQAAFLAGNLGKAVTVFTLNGVKLVGRLKQFDQYCLLLEVPDGLDSLVFKHAITTVTAASDAPRKQRQSEQAGA